MCAARTNKNPGELKSQLSVIAALIVAQVVVRAAIDPFVGDMHQYVPAYVATAVATWTLGWRCGAIAALGCLLSGEFFSPVSERDHLLTHATIAHMAFLGMAMTIISAAEWLRNDRADSAAEADVLRESGQRNADFIAVLAHELRNPLETLARSCDLLQGCQPDQNAQHVLGLVQRQTRHMTRLVEDLQDVVRVQTGKLSLTRELVDVLAAVQEAVDDVRASAQGKRQGIVIQREGVAGFVSADPGRLHQMLLNLLRNAVKFSPQDSTIEVIIRGKDLRVLISVVDQGVGIPAAELQRIFEPFVQLGGDTAAERGLGLGLPLTREIAQMHGGNVRAFSEGPGRGSHFLLSIPRSLPEDLHSALDHGSRTKEGER